LEEIIRFIDIHGIQYVEMPKIRLSSSDAHASAASWNSRLHMNPDE
jgi:hypothetical protein